jgi:proteasome accessory factor C
VRLRLHPGARWIADYYATTHQVEQPGGTLDVTLPAGRMGWVAALLLRVGRDVEILDPPELADDVVGLANRTLAQYVS